MPVPKLECYVAHPQPNQLHNIDQPPFPEGVGLLLGTPVASHIYQDGETLGGDTGRRAQFLADALGVQVMAYQELGPKLSPRDVLAARRRLTAAHFSEYAAEQAAQLTDALHAHDLGSVVMRVHSGTGPVGSQLAIDLHKQPEMTVSHLAISDPVGLIKTSFIKGAHKYVRYNHGAAKNTPQDHRNDPPTAPNRLSSLVTDIAVRGTTTWLGDQTYRNLVYIGNEQPDTAVRLHIPGNTFNGTPDEAKVLADAIRDDVNRTDTFVVEYVRDDYHSSSYDNLRRNASFILETWKQSR